MDFLYLPNQEDRDSKPMCEQNPNCDYCFDPGCYDCQCACVPMTYRPCI